jgi:ParB-like chromosome segregation protein Spo0J
MTTTRLKRKILKLEQIIFDRDIYPRQNYWWNTAYVYSQAMKSGAIFPPITVGLVGHKYLLVDGKHRQEALKLLKETHATCEIITGKNKQQLYIEAIRRNIAHGQVLTPYDKVRIIKRLEDMKIDTVTISKIVQVPMDKITQFVARRITLTPLGQTQILKAPLMHLSAEQIPMDDFEQDTLASRSEISLLNQMIQIFSNKQFPKQDRNFLYKVKELYALLDDFLKSKETKNSWFKIQEAERLSSDKKKQKEQQRKKKLSYDKKRKKRDTGKILKKKKGKR